jgi:hypothetical protein
MVTTYVVLREALAVEAGGEGTKIHYEFVGTVDANGAEQAIRKTVLAGGAKPVEGKYVAVPARSFNPQQVKITIPEPQLRIV